MFIHSGTAATVLVNQSNVDLSGYVIYDWFAPIVTAQKVPLAGTAATIPANCIHR